MHRARARVEVSRVDLISRFIVSSSSLPHVWPLTSTSSASLPASRLAVSRPPSSSLLRSLLPPSLPPLRRFRQFGLHAPEPQLFPGPFPRADCAFSAPIWLCLQSPHPQCRRLPSSQAPQPYQVASSTRRAISTTPISRRRHARTRPARAMPHPPPNLPPTSCRLPSRPTLA
jgi:hypothetical protein